MADLPAISGSNAWVAGLVSLAGGWAIRWMVQSSRHQEKNKSSLLDIAADQTRDLLNRYERRITTLESKVGHLESQLRQAYTEREHALKRVEDLQKQLTDALSRYSGLEKNLGGKP